MTYNSMNNLKRVILFLFSSIWIANTQAQCDTWTAWEKCQGPDPYAKVDGKTGIVLGFSSMYTGLYRAF